MSNTDNETDDKHTELNGNLCYLSQCGVKSLHIIVEVILIVLDLVLGIVIGLVQCEHTIRDLGFIPLG